MTKIGEEQEVHEDVPEPVPIPEEGDVVPDDLEPAPEKTEEPERDPESV